MGRLIDMTNQRIGRLIVLHKEGQVDGHVRWSCQCDCGKQKSIDGNSLRHGLTRSCGCLSRETTSQRNTIDKTLPVGLSARNNLLGRYKREAMKRELVWSLTDAEFMSLVGGRCHYCDVQPQQVHLPSKKSNGAFLYNGIDRQDNKIGYVPSNCVSCCGLCNAWKSNMSETEFYEHVRRIASNKKQISATAGGN